MNPGSNAWMISSIDSVAGSGVAEPAASMRPRNVGIEWAVTLTPVTSVSPTTIGSDTAVNGDGEAPELPEGGGADWIDVGPSRSKYRPLGTPSSLKVPSAVVMPVAVSLSYVSYADEPPARISLNGFRLTGPSGPTIRPDTLTAGTAVEAHVDRRSFLARTDRHDFGVFNRCRSGVVRWSETPGSDRTCPAPAARRRSSSSQ